MLAFEVLSKSQQSKYYTVHTCLFAGLPGHDKRQNQTYAQTLTLPLPLATATTRLLISSGRCEHRLYKTVILYAVDVEHDAQTRLCSSQSPLRDPAPLIPGVAPPKQTYK